MPSRNLLHSAFLLALFSAPGAAIAAEVAIADIQYTESASGASPRVGQVVTVTGVVTMTYGYGASEVGYVIAEDVGPWHAVLVADIVNGPPALGDEVKLTATVVETEGMTTLIGVTGYQVLSTGNPVTPAVISPGDVDSEAYESVLVRVENVTVDALLQFGEYTVLGADATTALCNDLLDYVYFPAVGDALDSLTGVVFYSFGAFKIEPRDTGDIAGDPIPHYALLGDVVTMNDSRDILPDAYVEILGDRIVAIHESEPGGMPIIDAEGLILPGLIDAHNHPQFNMLGPIPFNRLFGERAEWRNHPLYADFEDQHSAILDFDGGQFVNAVKLAEVRALTAGTTMIQGATTNTLFARAGVGANNASRFPSRAISDTFPLEKPFWWWPLLNLSVANRFVVHLAEGINFGPLLEFGLWKTMGVLNEKTTVIHGVPLRTQEWQEMAAADANLVWSPKSNVVLYGSTANVPGALAAGVNVALAPDWTESGSLTLLDEMKFAKQHSLANWGDAITPLQFTEFVTRNAARALGMEDYLGRIADGYRANLMVIPGEPGDPYAALLAADPADVTLTVVSGRPMYGDTELMGEFPFVENSETISVGGEEKTLALAVDSHAVNDSEKTFAEVLADLTSAYAAAEPKISDFVGLE